MFSRSKVFSISLLFLLHFLPIDPLKLFPLIRQISEAGNNLQSDNNVACRWLGRSEKHKNERLDTSTNFTSQVNIVHLNPSLVIMKNRVWWWTMLSIQQINHNHRLSSPSQAQFIVYEMEYWFGFSFCFLREHYFASAAWVSQTEVSVVWMNRAQNLSVVTLCKSPMWYCQEVRRVM